MEKLLFIMIASFVIFPLISIFLYISRLNEPAKSRVTQWMMYRFLYSLPGPIEQRYYARVIVGFLLAFWILAVFVILFGSQA